MTTGLLLVLALLSATGPFATDLYLPSFPLSLMMSVCALLALAALAATRGSNPAAA